MISIGTKGHDTVRLDPKQHLHCVGITQSGKSRLIEHICLQLFLQGKGFLLIDPHGKLYDRLIRRFSLLGYRLGDVTLFDSSAENPHGFDPFSFDGTDKEIWTKAELLASVTLQVWSINNADERPRFNNWLFNIYHTLIENKLSLSQTIDLLRYDAPIPNGRMKAEWEELHMMRRNDHYSFIEPLRSRFRPLKHPQLQTILSRDTLDLPRIIDEKRVMLASFRESGVLTEKSNQTLAALFIAYIWHHILARKEKSEFHIIIDEFQLFATEKVASIFDQASKFGLYLWLFHQREGHISKNVLDAMSNAAKIQFIGKRTFRLNNSGDRITTPHVPDLEHNVPLDEIAQRYIASSLPPPLLERPPIPIPEPIREPKPLREPQQLAGKGGATHKELQDLVAGAARSRHFIVHIEKDDVDVSIEGYGVRVAVEICVSQDSAYEAASAMKNLANGYDQTIVLTQLPKKAESLKRLGLTAMTFQDFAPFLRGIIKNSTDGKAWLTAQEVADLKGLAVETVRRMAARDELLGEKFGKEWRFKRDTLETFDPPKLAPRTKKVVVPRAKKRSKYDSMLD